MMMAVFTLSEYVYFAWGSVWRMVELGAGVAVIAFVPLYSKCFGMEGNMFPKWLCNCCSKFNRDLSRGPDVSAPKKGAYFFSGGCVVLKK